ncbi:MAG: hypothetical protein WCD34_10165, partial [Candidatus Acidiferrum sp.]
AAATLNCRRLRFATKTRESPQSHRESAFPAGMQGGGSHDRTYTPVVRSAEARCDDFGGTTVGGR